MKITPLTRVYHNGEKKTVADLCKALASEWKLGGDEPHKVVMMAVNMQFKEGYSLPDGIDQRTKNNLTKMASRLKKLFEDSAKRDEEEKAKKAQEEKEAKERKESMGLAMVKANEAASTAVAKVEKSAVDVTAYLGKAFKVVDGELVAAKDTITNEEFAKAFSGLEGLLSVANKINTTLATYEAQLAIIAEAHVGDDWINFFSSDTSKIKMIKQNMKAIKRASELGIALRTDHGEIPVGIARALLESRVSSGEADSDQKNDEFRKSVLSEYIEKSNEQGRRLTANEARQLVSEKKNQLGGSAKIQYTHLYVIASKTKDGGMSIKILPSLEKSINVTNLSKALLTVDRQLNVYTISDGNIVKNPIEAPSQKLVDAFQAAGFDTGCAFKKEKPAAATNKTPEPQEAGDDNSAKDSSDDLKFDDDASNSSVNIDDDDDDDDLKFE